MLTAPFTWRSTPEPTVSLLYSLLADVVEYDSLMMLLFVRTVVSALYGTTRVTPDLTSQRFWTPSVVAVQAVFG